MATAKKTVKKATKAPKAVVEAPKVIETPVLPTGKRLAALRK